MTSQNEMQQCLTQYHCFILVQRVCNNSHRLSFIYRGMIDTSSGIHIVYCKVLLNNLHHSTSYTAASCLGKQFHEKSQRYKWEETSSTVIFPYKWICMDHLHCECHFYSF